VFPWFLETKERSLEIGGLFGGVAVDGDWGRREGDAEERVENVRERDGSRAWYKEGRVLESSI